MTDAPVLTAPYGSWPSPITTELLTAGTVGLSETRIDGDDVYWIEGRASEGGRAVLVRRTSDGHCVDLTPAPFNVRSRVHE
ncbi:MAG: S9 family peptidase, partial [Actinomycetota bacterium]|nr:S9 family peptidase [Actinomycetota bacterium]